MKRFIDLTEDYWTDPESGHPCCAFLCTCTDSFMINPWYDGSHVFDTMASILEHSDGKRMAGLVPSGFFDTVHSSGAKPDDYRE